MAIINGMYIHVIDESVSRGVEMTSHPVESGLPTTDMVRPEAMSISLSGKIVDYGNMKAEQVIAKLKTLQETGSLITYQGRNIASSMQIRSFDTDFNNQINGGADFSLDLIQVRIAKSAYTPPKNSKIPENKKPTNPEIKVGMKVIFLGGKVYKSSDAKKAAATRKRSTCTVTKINKKSWAIHQYHLISIDGKKVYGWVDKKKIGGSTSGSGGTVGKTNAGTQQVKTGNKKSVYHTVKKGDCVYNLVNKKYAHLGKTCSWVVKNNPNCFSRKGDAKTLKVKSKLLMGYK